MHRRVGDRNATAGPVFPQEPVAAPNGTECAVRIAVEHDIAARRFSPPPGALPVCVVRIGHVDGEVAQAIKTLIRRGEARAAARSCGVAQENLHFLNMPFYFLKLLLIQIRVLCLLGE